MIAKNVLVPIATGIEEIEAVTIVDVLRRAGLTVRVSTIEEREVIGANGIKIVADSDFLDEALEDFDAIVVPGGSEAARRFAAHGGLGTAIKSFCHNNNLVAAICASPAVVLAPLGLLNQKKATCYPSLSDRIKNFVDERVVTDGNIITSQGPGTAMAFAFRVVEFLAGEKIAHNLKRDIIVGI
ncbi:MAG TPA: DJ-1 family glyoxalase III [Myxococcota bacterium]|nr:DJ-1 family glyoxalase III [Myxococcota bacterium]